MIEEPNPTQEEMARERTALAKDRTVMASERTVAAWIRTGLGAIAAGFALIKLAEGASPRWLATAAGVAATAAGLSLVLVGYGEYATAARRMKTSNLPHVSRVLVGLASVIIVASAIVALVLFVGCAGERI